MTRQARGRIFQSELETSKSSLGCRLLEAARETTHYVIDLFLYISQSTHCWSLLETKYLAGCTFALPQPGHSSSLFMPVYQHSREARSVPSVPLCSFPVCREKKILLWRLSFIRDQQLDSGMASKTPVTVWAGTSQSNQQSFINRQLTQVAWMAKHIPAISFKGLAWQRVWVQIVSVWFLFFVSLLSFLNNLPIHH